MFVSIPYCFLLRDTHHGRDGCSGETVSSMFFFCFKDILWQDLVVPVAGASLGLEVGCGPVSFTWPGHNDRSRRARSTTAIRTVASSKQ